MRIEDLDEFEEVTADILRGVLVARGWKQVGFRDGLTVHKQEGNADLCFVPDLLTGTDERSRHLRDTIDSLARQARKSLQSLLREINPRMRAGWPTDEELERHAFWMVRTLSDDGIRVLGAYVAREWKKAGIKVECWPCDQHGNKTRRGA